jgi:RNA polymerase sigma factor (sigma-70 family)
MTNQELLRAYAFSKSEDAFTTLVRNYTGLVHTAALRQTRDAHEAEEITQAVFLILARKAGTLPAKTVLSGWLLRTTHFVALNARRKRARRPMTQPLDPDAHATETDAAWKKLAPLLDEALVTLNEANRNAVSLRFFEGRSFKEIGAVVGVSEDAAQKRVSRALDLLRTHFVKRGVALSSTLLVGAIGTHAVQAAPAQVISGVAAAIGPGAAGAGNVASLVKLAVEAMNAARRRVILLRGGAVALLALLMLCGVRWFTPRPAPPPSAPPVREVVTPPVPVNVAASTTPVVVQARSNEMLFRVVDAETGAPIADARVSVTQDSEPTVTLTNVVIATDKKGECRLPVDRTPHEELSYYVEILKGGYPPQFANWSYWRGDTVADIPTKYEARLVRGAQVGGVVVDDEGMPVAGARVLLGVSGMAPAPGAPRERAGLATDYRPHTELTDAEGHWSCAHVPVRFDNLTLTVIHPEYAAANFGVAKLGATASVGGTPFLAEEDFRKQTARMVVRKGLIVKGLVVDDQGNSIAGAKVIENRDRHNSWATQLTGADGRFRLANTSAGELVVTVEAEGYVATDQTIHPEAQSEELQFALAPGARLRGRVVDETGVPVATATVFAKGNDFDSGRFDWSADTDAEGRFEWNSAPFVHWFYSVQAPGYKTRRKVELVADGSEQIVKLQEEEVQNPAARFSGTVTDRDTGQAIPDFEVWMGEEVAQPSPRPGIKWFAALMPALQTTGEGGKFGFPIFGLVGVARYQIQIKSLGYAMTETNIHGPLTNDCRLDLKLGRDELIGGRVLTPDGSPAAGAVVVSSSVRARARMEVGGQLDLVKSSAAHALTDPAGRFTLPDAAEAERIIVAHTAGYAEIVRQQFADSLLIALRPWGRIEGTLKIGSRPGGGKEIWVHDWSRSLSSSLSLTLTVMTDSAGHFAVENVPPGEWHIGRMLRLPNGRGTPTQLQPLDVQAGRTTWVDLGGKGWRVVGRVRPIGFTEPVNWQRDGPSLASKSAGSLLDSRSYVSVFDTNGAFTIDDVPPGTYNLNIRLTAPGPPGMEFQGLPLAALSQEITLPETSLGPGEAEFDALVLDLKAYGAK